MGETTDLASQQKSKFEELKKMLEAKYSEVQAESPVWPSWTFTNAEGKRIQPPEYAKKRKAKK